MSNKKVLFLKPPMEGVGKNVVRDFLYGCWCNGRRIGGMQMPPLTELMAASHARQDGLDVVFIDAEIEPAQYQTVLGDRFANYLAVVIMSSTQSFRADVAEFEKIGKLNPETKKILFGSHPTFMPEYCLQEPAVDYVVIQEPEESLRELLTALLHNGNCADILSVGYRDEGGDIHVNDRREFTKMDDLAIPDRSLLPKGADYFNPVVKRVPYTSMLTSRGCPARCNYCTAPVFYGNKTRVRSVESVLEEMRQIGSLGYREIFFRDETFSAYKGRNHRIFDGMLKEDMDFTWIANGRVDMIDEESMIAMKEAGCHLIKFGVETGSAAMLERYN